MARDVISPVVGDDGYESHPSWVLVGASRVSHSPPGAVLFDSDIRHQHYVVVRVKRATRKRDLHRDWKHGRADIIEIAMSEAQWASFVSSMNSGDGVPATLLWDGTIEDFAKRTVPSEPFAPRLQVSFDEVRGAANKLLEDVQAAFAAYEEKKTVGNLRTLKAAIENLPSNMSFAAQSLTEHAENVVQKARADVEAFVVQKAHQLGLDPSELGTLELEAGE